MGAFHVIANRLPQHRIAFCQAVLQCIDRMFMQNAGGYLCNLFRGESFRSRIACRKRYHRRVGGIFKNFADCRRLQTLNAVGKLIFHHDDHSFYSNFLLNFLLGRFLQLVLPGFDFQRLKSSKISPKSTKHSVQIYTEIIFYYSTAHGSFQWCKVRKSLWLHDRIIN